MMIEKIGSACTGCGSCVNICPRQCIAMVENEEGFLYPHVDQVSCINCGLCIGHCPIGKPISINKNEDSIQVYSLRHKNVETRLQSSSGGAFSAIAEYVLQQGGVVFGAAFAEDFSVHHIYVESISDLYKLRGSKYVQSDIGRAYIIAKEFLDTGRTVLFTGTACQTTGLLSFLGKDYSNLLTQDLICHGVPSPLAWKKYVKYREKVAKSKITSVFFRDKKYGWHNWHVKFSFSNGTIYSESQRDDMMIKSFLRGKISRRCCYECQFKQRVRLADFTLADFWGIEHISPELNDEKGLSEVFVNSDKARCIIENIKTNVELCEMNLDRTISYNMAMIESEEMRPDRDDFLKELRHKSFDMVSGKYNDEIGIGTKIRWTIRRTLGNTLYEKIRSLVLGEKNDT